MKINNLKINLPNVILALGLIVLSCILFYTCSDTNTPKLDLKPNYDSLLIEYSNLQVKNTYNDKLAKAKEIEIQELKKQKQPIKYVYLKGRTEILQAICDTSKVLSAYDSLYFSSLINENIIEQQDTLIYLLKDDLKNTDDLVKNRNSIIALNLLELEAEKNEHKTTKKKLRKQKLKTALVAVGVLITTGFTALILLR
jgi:hypothetical protein